MSDERIDLRRNPRLISMKSLWATHSQMRSAIQNTKIGFATSLRKQPPLVSPRNDVCETGAEIPHCMTTRHYPDLGSAFDCFLRLFSYSLPHASLFFVFLLTSHAEWTFHKWPAVSNHRILAFRRLLTEGSTVVKKKNTEQNKIDADHSNQLLRPYREKKKRKKKRGLAYSG